MTLNRAFALFAFAGFLFPAVAGAPTGKFFIIRGDHKAFPQNPTPIKETPINAEYTLVFEFQNWDTNKPISIKVSHQYPDGETKDFDVNRFSAGASSGACLIGMKRSDRDVPGTYLWRLTVLGIGTFEQRLSLLPETPDIVAAGAPYERAAENVFRAFSHYWLGYEGDYFIRLKETALNDYRGETLQVSGLSYRFSKQWVLTPEQKRKGITYQGSATFSFKKLRYGRHNGEWTKWINAHKGFFREKHPVFKELPVEFLVMEVDGNWLVQVANGAGFLNGRRLEPEVEDFKNAPSVATVQALLFRDKIIKQKPKWENPGRTAFREAGLEAKKNPDKLPQPMVDTILQLRGRPIAE